LLNDEATGDDLTTLGQILNEFYIEEGLWARNPTLTPEKLKATELVTDEYPILSDFVMYVEDYQDKLQSKKHTNKIELSSVNRIYNTFNEDNTITVYVTDEIELKRTDNFKEDVQNNVQYLINIMEDVIRKYPEQWMWFHDRWNNFREYKKSLKNRGN